MVGRWVLFPYNGKVLCGFVSSVDRYYARVRCGINAYYRVGKGNIAIAPDIMHPDDRAALIDMALDMGDREWFYSLVKGGDAVVTTHGGE